MFDYTYFNNLSIPSFVAQLSTFKSNCKNLTIPIFVSQLWWFVLLLLIFQNFPTNISLVTTWGFLLLTFHTNCNILTIPTFVAQLLTFFVFSLSINISHFDIKLQFARFLILHSNLLLEYSYFNNMTIPTYCCSTFNM